MRLFGQVNRKRGRVSAAAHAVIAGAEAAADQHCHLRHLGGGDRGDQLGAVLGDAARFIFAADHEAGNVLQEQQRRPALAGELDEMGALQGAFREQDAVIGEDRHRHPPDAGEAAHQSGAVKMLELVKLAAVDDPADHLAHLIGRADVVGDDAVKLVGVELRLDRLGDVDVDLLHPIEASDDVADDRQRMVVIVGDMVDHPRAPPVHLGPAQLLGRDHLAGRRLDQRRTGQEDRALVADDHALVRTSPGHRRRRRCSCPSRRRSGRCRGSTSAPGCRRSGRNGRGRERPRPGAAGSPRPNRPDRRKGSRFCSAISCARRCFLTVIGK